MARFVYFSLYVTVIEADIEFTATKEHKARTWSSLLSVGLNAYFNTSASKIFVHRVKLIICTPDSSVKLRRPVTIEISKEQADRCMEHYNHFKGIISTMGGPQDNTAPSLLPGEIFIAMCHLLVETLANHEQTLNTRERDMNLSSLVTLNSMSASTVEFTLTFE
jgi:hypothetical protein